MIVMQLEGMAELERALARAPGEVVRAARNALNDTGRAVQADFRGTLPGKFEIVRKSFVDRQVHLQVASKESLTAVLSIRGPAGKTSTLEKFEASGTKRAREGRLAIPTRDIRTRGGHVKPGMQLRNFLPIVTLGGSYTKLRKRKGKLVAGKTLTSGVRLVGQRGSFIVTLQKSGKEALARSRKGSKGIEVLYVFQPSTPIPRSLQFERHAKLSAARHMPAKVTEAIEHGIRRAGLK